MGYQCYYILTVHFLCYTIHLASQPDLSVLNCRVATGNKTCSVCRSPNTPKIKWTVYTICLHFQIKWLLRWQFYFLKMAGDQKAWYWIIVPNDKILSYKNSIIMITTECNSERPHFQRRWLWKYFRYSFSQ